jgi:hypothetical protein
MYLRTNALQNILDTLQPSWINDDYYENLNQARNKNIALIANREAPLLQLISRMALRKCMHVLYEVSLYKMHLASEPFIPFIVKGSVYYDPIKLASGTLFMPVGLKSSAHNATFFFKVPCSKLFSSLNTVQNLIQNPTNVRRDGRRTSKFQKLLSWIW